MSILTYTKKLDYYIDLISQKDFSLNNAENRGVDKREDIITHFMYANDDIKSIDNVII